MITGYLEGVTACAASLKRKGTAVAAGCKRGITKSALLLQGWSQEIAPVEFGILKNSAYTKVEGAGFDAVASVGYTAAYALYVHENLDAVHGSAYNAKYADEIAAGKLHTRGPNQQARFLIEPAIEHRTDIIDTIQAEAAKGALA